MFRKKKTPTSAQSSCNGHKNSAQCISLMAFLCLFLFFSLCISSMQVQFQQQKENMLLSHALYHFNTTLSTCLNFGCSFLFAWFVWKCVCVCVYACFYYTFHHYSYFVAGYSTGGTGFSTYNLCVCWCFWT